jgi:hypothetical protein
MILAAFTIVFTQVSAPGPDTKSGPRWCFDRGQGGALLCEQTEAECNRLHDINPEIAQGPCKPVELPVIQNPPTKAPAPLNPQATPPTQR